MTWLDRWSRRGLGREGAERVSAGCYGSIVAASTLAGSAAVPPGELALLVVATNLVYFSTHVFAYSIGDPNVEGKHLPQVAAHHARVAAPMVSAAFLPTYRGRERAHGKDAAHRRMRRHAAQLCTLHKPRGYMTEPVGVGPHHFKWNRIFVR